MAILISTGVFFSLCSCNNDDKVDTLKRRSFIANDENWWEGELSEKYLRDKNFGFLVYLKDNILVDVNHSYENVKGNVRSWYEEFGSRK